ncbi:TPA: hypothetical protein ACH3X3_006850 [Trebouxia sp. C0006]
METAAAKLDGLQFGTVTLAGARVNKVVADYLACLMLLWAHIGQQSTGSPTNEEHPRSHGPELEQPYDQIINSTDYLELINAIEHGHVSLRLTAQEITESRTAGSDVYLDANGLEEAVEELTLKGSNEFIHKPLGNSVHEAVG